VSSSYIQNPIALKEEVSRVVLARIQSSDMDDPIAIMRCAGDPMMPVAAGIASSFSGNLVLGGGTQMLAITALLKKMGKRLPYIITTVYIKEDPTAKAEQLAREIGTPIIFVDPAFGDLGHAGLARYCIGEVKEGMGAGGAMALAYLLGFSPDEIRQKIFETVSNYA
jgi:NaMN:DMB phosphoribosyltransferase